jgi:hypothetical protein
MYEGLSNEITKAAAALTKQVTRDATSINDFREFNEAATRMDPSKVAWPSTLPIELALKTASPQELKEHYGFTDEEWAALRHHPVFIRELAAACELMKQDGMSFKAKCKLQAEGMLETNWRLVHAPSSEVPAAVKARLMETTFRMAGYDSKEGVGNIGSQLAIQINFGAGQTATAQIEERE